MIYSHVIIRPWTHTTPQQKNKLLKTKHFCLNKVKNKNDDFIKMRREGIK